jgi:hypothetical protein
VRRTARSAGNGAGARPDDDPADVERDGDGDAGAGHAAGTIGDGPGAPKISMARAAGNAPVIGASRAGGAGLALSATHPGRDGRADGNGGTSETLSLVVAAMAVRTEISVMRGADGVIMAAAAQAPDPAERRVTTLEPAAGRAGDDGRGGGRTSGSGVSEEREDREGVGGRIAGNGVSPLADEAYEGVGGRIAGSGVSDDFDCAGERMAGSDAIDGLAGGTMVPSATLRRTSLRRRASGGEESWAVMAFFPQYADLRTCRW